jgi:hypothetical protein
MAYLFLLAVDPSNMFKIGYNSLLEIFHEHSGKFVMKFADSEFK